MRWGRPGDLAQVPAGFFVLRCNVAMAVSIFRDIRRNRILPSNWIVAQLVLILILILIWMLWRSTFLHLVAAHPTAARIASKHAIFLVGFDWGSDGLINSAPDAVRFPRLWVVLVDEEKPAVDLDVVRQCMKQAFDQTVGAFHITRFDACATAAGGCCR
jgi:hypothetical protein